MFFNSKATFGDSDCGVLDLIRDTRICKCNNYLSFLVAEASAYKALWDVPYIHSFSLGSQRTTADQPGQARVSEVRGHSPDQRGQVRSAGSLTLTDEQHLDQQAVHLGRAEHTQKLNLLHQLPGYRLQTAGTQTDRHTGIHVRPTVGADSKSGRRSFTYLRRWVQPSPFKGWDLHTGLSCQPLMSSPSEGETWLIT